MAIEAGDIQALLPQTVALAQMIGESIISMGISFKLYLVAEGKANFYPSLGPIMEWATAGHAVVSAAGGVVDIAGNELQYNKPDLHNTKFFVQI